MRIFCLLATAAILVLPAQADGARNVLSEIAKCSDIAAAKDRLDCFDKAAAGAKTALAATPQQTAEVEAQQEEESGGGVLSWFGLSDTKPVTKKEDFGKPPVPKASVGPKEITEITATVLEYAQNALGRSIFILENGQVWKQIDGDVTEVRAPKGDEPMVVKIEKAFMGSYSLTIEGRNGLIKVRRVK